MSKPALRIREELETSISSQYGGSKTYCEKALPLRDSGYSLVSTQHKSFIPCIIHHSTVSTMATTKMGFDRNRTK